MRGVTESMAGRAAVLQLLPLAVAETPNVSLLRGDFPEVLARPSTAQTWFRATCAPSASSATSRTSAVPRAGEECGGISPA